MALWMNGVFGHELYSGIHEWLIESSAAWRIKFVTMPDTFRRSFAWLRRIGTLDGVISHFGTESDLGEAADAGIPVVVVTPDGDGLTDPARKRTGVFLDYAELGRAALGHFLSRSGFRSFGYVEHPTLSRWTTARGDAFGAALAERGLKLNRFAHRRFGGTDYAALGAWLRALEKPAAVLCANDDVAVDAVNVCERAGVAVPRDVAVLGMDDNPLHCGNSVPNLSSIHFDARKAGRLAAETLAGMMDGLPVPETPPRYGVLRIAQRASTGTVSTAGALVQKALDYIESHACQGATTADVVRHLGVSYALATMRFREANGKSILDAVMERRVEEAKTLLRETDKPVGEIARESGFSGAGPFCRAFRAATGLAPGRYRQSRESS